MVAARLPFVVGSYCTAGDLGDRCNHLYSITYSVPQDIDGRQWTFAGGIENPRVGGSIPSPATIDLAKSPSVRMGFLLCESMDDSSTHGPDQSHRHMREISL